LTFDQKSYNRAYMREYYRTHPKYRERNNSKALAWWKAHPEKRRAKGRRMRERKFDVKYPDETLCARCGKPISGRQVCLDHDHKTMKFRGWLCQRCNTFVGWLEKRLSLIEGDLLYVGATFLYETSDKNPMEVSTQQCH